MTEVMVGGAILGGVVLAGARMFKDQKTAQKKVESDVALNAYHSSIVKIMHNANNCNATLSAYAGAQGTGAWAAPTQIKTCTSCTNPGTDYTASTAMTTATALSSGAWVDNTQTWQVTGMQIGASETAMGTGPSATGRAIMRITYQVNPNLPSGGRKVSKDIVLNLRFTQAATPRFIECLSGNESSVNNLAYDMCMGMKTQVSSTGILMWWDDATQTCQRTTSLKSCPAGTVVDGIRSDGSVKCKAFSSGINPNEDLMLQSACAPPATVRLEVVNGKIKATCQ